LHIETPPCMYWNDSLRGINSLPAFFI
jgi:hypothetical protein